MPLSPNNIPGTVQIQLIEDTPQDADLTLRALEQFKLSNRLAWVKDGGTCVGIYLWRFRQPKHPCYPYPKGDSARS